MTQFEPLYDAHAIEQVGISVLFSRPLAGDALRAAFRATDGLIADFPLRDVLQTFGIQFGPGAAGAPIPITGENGWLLKKMADDNASVEADLRLESQQIAFSSRVYTRWADHWGRAKRYLETLLPLYVSSDNPIQTVSLSYLDKFYWSGDATDAKYEGLVREGSQFLAPHVASAPDLWHSYTGLFIPVDKQTKRLLSLNADCVDQNLRGTSRRVVAFTTTLTDMLNQPGYDPCVFDVAQALEFVCARFELLHRESKQVLADVLSEAQQRRIGLVT